MLLREPPVWNKDATALLAQFLESSAGSLFLARLAHLRPALSGDAVDSVALQAKLVEGYERAIGTILSLAEAPPVEEPGASEAYPPLDDEDHWKKEAE